MTLIISKRLSFLRIYRQYIGSSPINRVQYWLKITPAILYYWIIGDQGKVFQIKPDRPKCKMFACFQVRHSGDSHNIAVWHLVFRKILQLVSDYGFTCLMQVVEVNIFSTCIISMMFYKILHNHALSSSYVIYKMQISIFAVRYRYPIFAKSPR